MKIYFNYDRKEREGFEYVKPPSLKDERLSDSEGSVEEITGELVLEKVHYLVSFIEECYRLLKPGGTATFTAPYYDAWQAWQDPRNIRGISQGSLNFASKTWREQNGCPDLATCDFEVGCNFAVDLSATQRSDAAREFWLARYKNVVQSIMFVLTKKEA